MGFFKNLFGKKPCALCGKECGVMTRNKIRNKEYICNDCGAQCSKYIRLSELTLDEIKGHIEYMKRQERLFKEVFVPCTGKDKYPTTPQFQGIEFCDSLGMFRIIDRSSGRGKMQELFRYDQVESYESYVEETKPSEPGKEPEFKECGVKIRLIGENTQNTNLKFGTRPHPYIKREIKLCYDKKEKSYDIINTCNHFDGIFGVHDNRTGLFGGISKAEKRDINAAKGAIDMFAGAIKAAKEGQLSEENLAKIENGANAIQDASTGGLAVYTRRADEAEASIK